MKPQPVSFLSQKNWNQTSQLHPVSRETDQKKGGFHLKLCLQPILCKNSTFFVSSFSETRAVIWVSGQLFETGMKLWPVSSEFVKIRIPAEKIENLQKMLQETYGFLSKKSSKIN